MSFGSERMRTRAAEMKRLWNPFAYFPARDESLDAATIRVLTTFRGNPLCQCGCGREVRLPSNKYVLGHGTGKLKATPYYRHARPVITQAEIDRSMARHMLRKANASLQKVRAEILKYERKQK